MAKYRWQSAVEWLDWALGDMDHPELLETARSMARSMDSDDIQDMFQPDMEADGYFDELSTVEGTITVTIADNGGQIYPGDIVPGRYDLEDLVELFRHHKENPAAIEFLADAMRGSHEEGIEAPTKDSTPTQGDGADAPFLTIPDYEQGVNVEWPGDIKPGVYSRNELVGLLRRHRANPRVVQFIADMLEK